MESLGVRQERHLMRQRGAGARAIQGNFGFVFKAGPVPVQAPPPVRDVVAAAVINIPSTATTSLPVGQDDVSIPSDQNEHVSHGQAIKDKSLSDYPEEASATIVPPARTVGETPVDSTATKATRKIPKKRKALFTKKKPPTSRSTKKAPPGPGLIEEQQKQTADEEQDELSFDKDIDSLTAKELPVDVGTTSKETTKASLTRKKVVHEEPDFTFKRRKDISKVPVNLEEPPRIIFSHLEEKPGPTIVAKAKRIVTSTEVGSLENEDTQSLAHRDPRREHVAEEEDLNHEIMKNEKEETPFALQNPAPKQLARSRKAKASDMASQENDQPPVKKQKRTVRAKQLAEPVVDDAPSVGNAEALVTAKSRTTKLKSTTASETEPRASMKRKRSPKAAQTELTEEDHHLEDDKAFIADMNSSKRSKKITAVTEDASNTTSTPKRSKGTRRLILTPSPIHGINLDEKLEGPSRTTDKKPLARARRGKATPEEPKLEDQAPAPAKKSAAAKARRGKKVIEVDKAEPISEELDIERKATAGRLPVAQTGLEEESVPSIPIEESGDNVIPTKRTTAKARQGRTKPSEPVFGSEHVHIEAPNREPSAETPSEQPAAKTRRPRKADTFLCDPTITDSLLSKTKPKRVRQPLTPQDANSSSPQKNKSSTSTDSGNEKPQKTNLENTKPLKRPIRTTAKKSKISDTVEKEAPPPIHIGEDLAEHHSAPPLPSRPTATAPKSKPIKPTKSAPAPAFDTEPDIDAALFAPMTKGIASLTSKPKTRKAAAAVKKTATAGIMKRRFGRRGGHDDDDNDVDLSDVFDGIAALAAGGRGI